MGFLPTNKEIKEEVNNYDELPFFKKIKNGYVAAIILVCVITFFANDILPTDYSLEASGLIGTIIFYLILAAFIFYNHRWAMIVFCSIFVIDKVLIIFSQYSNPITQIIFGAVVVGLTYHSFKVATELKKKQLEE